MKKIKQILGIILAIIFFLPLVVSAAQYPYQSLIVGGGGSFIMATSSNPLTVGSIIASSTTANSYVLNKLIAGANGDAIIGDGVCAGTFRASLPSYVGCAEQAFSFIGGGFIAQLGDLDGGYAGLFQNTGAGDAIVRIGVQAGDFAMTTSNGNVGISSTSPASTLSVLGTFYASGKSILANGRVKADPATLEALTITNLGGNGIVASTTLWKLTTNDDDNGQGLRLVGADFYAGQSVTLLDGSVGTSTFTRGVTAETLNTSSTTATSSFANGISLTSGCFSINGSCLALSLTGGSPNTLAYWTSPTAISATGTPTVSAITATSTTATSTFKGGFVVGSNMVVFDPATGSTTISNLYTGNLTFDTDSGIQTAFDLPIVGAGTGVVQSYSFNIDASTTPNLTIYGESNGSGAVKNQRLGSGTTTPTWAFSLVGMSATTATSTFSNGSPGKPSCQQWFSPNSTAYREYMSNAGAKVIEAGYCPQ